MESRKKVVEEINNKIRNLIMNLFMVILYSDSIIITIQIFTIIIIS